MMEGNTKGIYVNHDKVMTVFQHLRNAVPLLRELGCRSTLDHLSFRAQDFLDDMFDRREISEREWEEMCDEAGQWDRNVHRE
jgi:hypothetical protein